MRRRRTRCLPWSCWTALALNGPGAAAQVPACGLPSSIAAANNMPIPSFPSLYASVISVASQEDPDPLHFCYNPAPPVEFSAPGIDVRVAWTGGSYVRSTGNSYAAPHITGLVARMLAHRPQLTPFQVKTILRATAYNVR